MFVRNCWYVFGWSRQLEATGGPIGRVVIGDPVAIWRDAAGTLHAVEDRCPHRHAPLSLGRVEGDRLRCMYHGMTFDGAGRCTAMPLVDPAPDVRLRSYPVAERSDWLWVWMGDPARADPALIPEAFGISDPDRPMRANSIEYAARYQLLHDNLCDTSHLDFVHSTTLQPITGADWSASLPRVKPHARGIRVERWFVGAHLPGDAAVPVDTWSAYDFFVPGVLIMRGARYPAGTAAACDGREPQGVEPLSVNLEQQAVTPISSTRTAYHFATGLVGGGEAIARSVADRMDVVAAAFEEDRIMIEAQQRIWDLTGPDVPKRFLPQDKAPFLMRQIIAKMIAAETAPEPGQIAEECAVRTMQPA